MNPFSSWSVRESDSLLYFVSYTLSVAVIYKYRLQKLLTKRCTPSTLSTYVDLLSRHKFILPSQIWRVGQSLRMQRQLLALKSSPSLHLPTDLVEETNTQLQRIQDDHIQGEKLSSYVDEESWNQYSPSNQNIDMNWDNQEYLDSQPLRHRYSASCQMLMENGWRSCRYSERSLARRGVVGIVREVWQGEEGRSRVVERYIGEGDS